MRQSSNSLYRYHLYEANSIRQQIHLVGRTCSIKDEVFSWKRGDTAEVVPWHQRHPCRWFKPFFAMLLFVRKRWEPLAHVTAAPANKSAGLSWWAVLPVAEAKKRPPLVREHQQAAGENIMTFPVRLQHSTDQGGLSR